MGVLNGKGGFVWDWEGRQEDERDVHPSTRLRLGSEVYVLSNGGRRVMWPVVAVAGGMVMMLVGILSCCRWFWWDSDIRGISIIETVIERQTMSKTDAT
jgi:hypothetical protein